ncbi:cell cycle protein kinase dbf2-related [Anaeramoeba flamelloides]|uniref:non-specific serine/threonine protein kinase n=1 Tax=Anaeramoeba flamelloides TaxID=1746091 RepID=A0ABQ8XKZ7_9EUKA|nr:cell cycle protein kinase dbf2-related [Anaeramoeba flamelloides]
MSLENEPIWDQYSENKNKVYKISSEVRDKSALCKSYLGKYSLEFGYYLHQRKKRIHLAKKQIQEKKMGKKGGKFVMKEVYFNESMFLRNRRTRIIVEDFITLAKIGQGSYGEVFLVKPKSTFTRSKCFPKAIDLDFQNKKLKNEEKEEINEKDQEKEKEKEKETKTEKEKNIEKEAETQKEKEKENEKERLKEKPPSVLALKRVKKSSVNTQTKMKNIWTEREVLATHNSPWLVKLLATFQDDEYLYFVMNYHSGGDLKSLISEVGAVNEDAAKFYLAEMFLSVEDLHKQGFIHRDIKPENFLISSNGHLKLTDFGLSKNIFMDQKNWKTTIERMTREETNKPKHYTLVGTPNYMSPEILSRKGYNNSIDFWALGCILYELLAGFPPFLGRGIKETLRNIIFYTKTLTSPTTTLNEQIIPEVAWDLITKLLQVPIKDKPEIFLQKMKKHKFFEGIDFDQIREITPPFVPQLENEMDISYFDTSYFQNFDGQLTTVINHVGRPKLFSKKDINNNFVGFSFRRYEY